MERFATVHWKNNNIQAEKEWKRMEWELHIDLALSQDQWWVDSVVFVKLCWQEIGLSVEETCRSGRPQIRPAWVSRLALTAAFSNSNCGPIKKRREKAEKVGLNRGKLLCWGKSQRRARAIGPSPIQTVAFQAAVLMSNTADVRGHKQLFRVNSAHYR